MPASTPKVSVCIVTYNHEQYIEACLSSVLSQETEFGFEVIVGEDCSTDATGALVDAIAARDKRIRVLRPQRNVGGSKNFLATHNEARGEYVVYLDGDDLMEPGKLAKQVLLLDLHPELSACAHQMRIVDSNGDDMGAVFPVAPLRKGFDLGRLIRFGLPVFPSSLMYRRSARTLRDADFEIYDWYIFTDILKSGPAGYIHECLGAYRIHPTSHVARERGSLMTRRMVGLYRRRLAELPHYRSDFMARGLMWAWHGFFDEKQIEPEVWGLIGASFTTRVVGPFLDAFLWARANKAAAKR